MRVKMTLVCLIALGVLASSTGAAPYWIACEGNDLPENEGWERNWGDWGGQYNGDGAIRTVEDGILTTDSLFDAGVYDFAFVDRPGQVDPEPGEAFVMEWRVLVEETTGEPDFDEGVFVASNDAWLLGFGVYPNAVVSVFEDVTIPIEPWVFHEYRAVSVDMLTYELYIDGTLSLTGYFWDGLTEGRISWGEGTQGVASLAHWDYFSAGVIPEPSSLWLLVAALTACVTRTTRGGLRRVFLLPVFVCILAVSATADPYWCAYEGNDLPENEGWTRYWGNRDGEYQGDGSIRTIEDGVLRMDSLHDPWIWDWASIERPGETDPEAGETFIMEWRLNVVEVEGLVDPGVSLASDDGWRVGFAYHTDHIWCFFEDEVTIPILPGVFHSYRFLSQDMRTYELYIDEVLVHDGSFWEGLTQGRVAWGDLTKPAVGLAEWDYIRFGVVPEPQSISILFTMTTIWASRARR